MKLFNYLNTICLFSLVGAKHSTLHDVAQTSVGLTSDPSNPDHFIVSVERVDDIVNESGVTLAERLVSVALNFEVSDDLLLLNGEKVGPLGSKMTLSKVNATYVRGDLSKATQEKLSTLFVQGIISLSVSTEVENFIILDEFDPFGLPALGRHITITEDILEVDGSVVKNSQYSEQVIDLFANGTMVRTMSKPHLDSKMVIHKHEKYPCKGSQTLHLLKSGHYKEAWSRIHPALRGALIGITFGLVFSLLAVFPVYLFMVARRRRLSNQASYLPVDSDDLPPYNDRDAVIFSETKPYLDNEIDGEEKITILKALDSEDRL